MFCPTTSIPKMKGRMADEVSNDKPAVPRPAATLILVRDSAGGIEVLMLQRSQKARFAAGAFVFPGGVIDPADSGGELAALCAGIDDAAASRELDLERGGLAYRIGAIRECFEEAGLIFACDADGVLVEIVAPDAVEEFTALRRQVNAGDLRFAAICGLRDLRLAADRLAYLSHWITPVDRPLRYDTRFFVAIAPPAQLPLHDGRETTAQVWIDPADALERHRRGEFELRFPTMKTLELLARFANTAALMGHARSTRVEAPVVPRLASGRAGQRLLGSDDFAYAEVGKLDPDGRGSASYELLPGVVTPISGKVRRITAPNSGFMTGPGTNAYLLGAGGDIAVIDPGPADAGHVRALIEEAKGRIRWILVTHTHMDHSPAAALLKARTGAELIGMPPPAEERQDQSFSPDRVPAHGERITLAGCVLRAIHTPGHASNHLCYLLEDERLLFTGDHVMQGSTVVINPPDGDMRAYLASLNLLFGEDIAWIAPAHGFLIDRPHAAVEWLLQHRLERENKVVDALRSTGETAIDVLLPLAYDDVPARIHPVASRSLLAHLIKLRDDGRIAQSGERWRLMGSGAGIS
jgi:glyoxylase-like metal-dependent hydrolase (beta-lactamase superfamily II)/8-oxo-dGTP pyrophosphatase MutT (NUDIX family)